MCILGRDPRTDAERRRLYRLACDALILLRHRNPGRSEEALEDAVGDAVVKWLSVELPIPLTDPQVSCWLVTTSSHFLFRSTLKGTPYLERLEGPCPVEGEAWIQERVLVREVLARYRQLRITARTHQSMELWSRGCTSAEISAEVGITAASARQKIRRCVASVRQAVRRGEPPSADPQPTEIP